MAFFLGLLRYDQARDAYETHARVTGQTASRIRRSLSRREPSGYWHLSDGQRIVAIVTPRKAVRIVTQEIETNRMLQDDRQ